MGWFGNRLFRGATNRARQRLAAEYGAGPVSGILAVSLGYACYPNATYGDNGAQDEAVAYLKRFYIKPSEATASCASVELWLDRHAISTVDLFRRVWGHGPDSFLEQFIEFMTPDKESEA